MFRGVLAGGDGGQTAEDGKNKATQWERALLFSVAD